MNDLLNIARNIAYTAHSGQFRRNGLPYYMHVHRVSEKFSDINEKIVALLHDVLEDSEVTEEELIERGIPKEIVDVLIILNKSNYNSYSEYILNIKNNELATKIKIQDIIDNLNDKPKEYKVREYALALLTLTE